MSVDAPQAETAADPAPSEPPRAWWQFSLRTLFVLTIILAIPLAWLASGPERQRVAAIELREAGAGFRYAINGQSDEFKVDAPYEEPEQGWLPLDYWYPMESLKLPYDCKLEKLLHMAQPCSSLRSIDASHIYVTKDGVRLLRSFPRLTHLYIRNAEFDDACLADLAECRSLIMLDVSGTDVTGTGLKHLASLPELRELSLAMTGVTDDNLADLHLLASVEILNLSSCGSVTRRGMQHVAKMPSLKILRMPSGDGHLIRPMLKEHGIALEPYSE